MVGSLRKEVEPMPTKEDQCQEDPDPREGEEDQEVVRAISALPPIVQGKAFPPCKTTPPLADETIHVANQA